MESSEITEDGSFLVLRKFQGFETMPTGRANDLRSFCDFANELTVSGAELTLDEALDRWEYENSSEAEREETIQAIQRGLDDMHAGRTVDAFEFLARMRQKLQSADKP